MEKTIAVGNVFIELESGLHCRVREIQLADTNQVHIVLRYKDNTEMVFKGSSYDSFVEKFVRVPTEF
jgi:hypothetical protein